VPTSALRNRYNPRQGAGESFELLDGFDSCLGQRINVPPMDDLWIAPSSAKFLEEALLLSRFLFMRNGPTVKQMPLHDPLDERMANQSVNRTGAHT
jgi:hypothetical protein